EVAVLAERHGVDDSTALAELLERTDAARVAAGELDDRIAAMADAVAQRRRGHADAVARLAELRAEVGTDDLDAAAERGRRLVELTADIDRLTALVRVAVPDDAVAELATQEPAVLRAGLAQADADLAAADADLRAALTAQGEAAQRERDLVGRTGAAELHARAEERLAVLTESVERYLVVHIQRTVLGAELDAYERKHASPLLAEAGRILEGLTGGRYVALRAANRSLVVVAADDEMRDPAHLSEGTADQVFLALRLAGIASLQQDRLARGLPALPVVLDDVLMTFDDERSAAALRVLAEFAREWQVVVLSHHEHLADLAPPDATVSHLAPPPAMTQARPAADIRARVPQGSAVRRPVDVSARGEVRLWARENGFSVGDRGRIPADVLAAYARAHR
ncbi:MAG TPA: histone-like nucleoid-structuring protein Lsr2, partial [Pseudonocardiaceae bacterium]|nr:histone-like nucleoid-structuring protein Lsr2 [Pseudonocardiaceae bacterium]